MAVRTLRTNEEDERAIDVIRQHLTDTIGNPSESDVLRYGLRAALRELAGKPKPRSPRMHRV